MVKKWVLYSASSQFPYESKSTLCVLPARATILLESARAGQLRVVAVDTYFQKTGLNTTAAAATISCQMGFQEGLHGQLYRITMFETNPENQLSPYQSRWQTGCRPGPKGSTWWSWYGRPDLVERESIGHKGTGKGKARKRIKSQDPP